ncbi:YdgA family protein [Pseudomonas sp. F1_0610]|uniref:YdgA family protein n=1 Tax=Pseudomonas sp. F1_0610 TaxID=3114284 RepID=UPI0039C2F6DC
MGKKSIVALAVVAAGYLGTTWFLGEKTEEAYRQTIGEVNQQLASFASITPEIQFSVEIKEYNRGFFSSDAVFEIGVGNGNDKSSFEYKEHIEHGPLPFEGVMRGELMPVLARAQGQLVENESIKEWFDLVAKQGNIPVNTVTYIGFNTKGRTEINFSPIDVEENFSSVKLSPAHFTINYDLLARDFNIDGALPSFVMNEVKGDDETKVNMTIENIKLTTAAVGYGLPNGHNVTDFQIDKIQLDNTAVLTNLTVDSTEKVIDGISNIVANYNIEHVKFKEYDVGSMKAGIRISRFNRAAVDKLQRLYMRSADNAAAMNIVGELLTPKPEFSLDNFHWKNNSGEINSSLSVQFSMIDLAKVESSIVGIVMGLVPHASYKMEFSRDMLADLLAFAEKETGESAEAQLAMFDVFTAILSEEKLVTLKDNKVLVDFTLDNGKVTLNGVEMTLQELADKLQRMAGLSQLDQAAEGAETVEDFEDWEGYDEPMTETEAIEQAPLQ